MELTDRLYGKFSVTEPVLLELLNSTSIQRLKRINQYGMPDELYHIPGFTRYEHSLGVMLLLRKLGASIEEQAAGLLHDVSHTAFGHIVDWIPSIGSQEKEDFQDRIHKTFIVRSNLPKILQRHELNPEDVVDYKHFSLLEQPAPALCADRVDYTLREFADWIDPEAARLCTETLLNYHGKILFATRESSERFGTGYARCNREHWSGSQGIRRYHLLSQALSIALDSGIITLDTLFEDDSFVLEKLRAASHPTIDRILRTLSKKEFHPDEENPQLRCKKFRYVNPPYLENGIIHTLMETSPSYKKIIEQDQERNKKGINVNVQLSD